MSTREALLNEIDAYLAASGMTPRQFSLKVTADHKWLARLRRGQVSLSSIERAEAFMKANPADADAIRHSAAQSARRDPVDVPVRHPEPVAA